MEMEGREGAVRGITGTLNGKVCNLASRLGGRNQPLVYYTMDKVSSKVMDALLVEVEFDPSYEYSLIVSRLLASLTTALGTHYQHPALTSSTILDAEAEHPTFHKSRNQFKRGEKERGLKKQTQDLIDSAWIWGLLAVPDFGTISS